MVESGELAEHFIKNNFRSNPNQIAEEMADILFGTLYFASDMKIDVSNAIGLIINKAELTDANCSYEELQKAVLQNLDKFYLFSLKAEQVVFSLIWQVSQIGDIFIWDTKDESIIRAKEKYSFIATHIAHIVAHLIYLSTLIEIDLPKEFIRKMEKNSSKYPVNSASRTDYIQIKDGSREHKK